MFENEWKNWLLVLVALVGISFEVLKHLPTNDVVVWDAENLHFSGVTKPYSIREANERRERIAQRRAAQHVAGNTQLLESEVKKFAAATEPTQTDFEHKKTPEELKKAKKKKKTDGDEWEEVLDPKTGKMVRRKKKKDAKKDEKKNPVAQAQPAAEPLTPPPTPDPVLPPVNAFAPPPIPDSGFTAGGYTAPGAAAGSLQDWMTKLLNHPDRQQTLLFIQAFKAGHVTSDIFYKIATAMVDDPRPAMQELGVLCAGSTASVLSFSLLAQVYKKQPASSSLHTEAAGYLAHYTDTANLPTLEKVLRSTDLYSATLAAQLLDTAATQALAAGGAGGTTPNPSTQTTYAQEVTNFTPFLVVLQGLVNNPNASLSTQAKRTLADLQALLNVGSAASSTTASTVP